jgi:hypothetical protein
MILQRLLNPNYPLLNETLLIMYLLQKEEDYKNFIRKNFPPDIAEVKIRNMEIQDNLNYV